MDCSVCTGSCTQGGPQSATVRGHASYTPFPPKKKRGLTSRAAASTGQAAMVSAAAISRGSAAIAVTCSCWRSSVYCWRLAWRCSLVSRGMPLAVRGQADDRAPVHEPGLEDATDDIEHAGLDDAAADRL